MASAKTVQATPVFPLILKLDQVEEDPANARQTFDPESLQRLADSLAAQGQLQPVVVRLLPSGKYRLIDGHRRFRAAQLAKLGEIRCELVELDDQAAALAAATANLQREDLTPYEEARAYKSILELLKAAGKKSNVAEVARLCSVAHNTVKHRLQLLDLPEAVAQRIGDNGFSIQHAQAFLPIAKEPEMLEAGLAYLAKLKPDDLPEAEYFGEEIASALQEKKLLANKYDVDRYYDLRTLDKHLAKVATIEVGDATFFRDMKAFDQAVEAAREDAKKTAAAAKEEKTASPAKQNEAKRLEARALELARNKQIELLEQHVGALGKWNDDLQRQLVLGFLHHASAPARNDDRAAEQRTTGLDEEQVRVLTLDWESKKNPEKIRKLFRDHEKAILKLVACRLFFDRQAHDGVSVGQRYLNIPHVAAPKDKLLTGKSYDDVLEEAKETVKAEAKAKAKPAKAPAGKGPKKPKPGKPAPKAKGKPAKKPVKETAAVAQARAKLAEQAKTRPKAEKGKQAQLPRARGSRTEANPNGTLPPAAQDALAGALHAAQGEQLDPLPPEMPAAEPVQA